MSEPSTSAKASADKKTPPRWTIAFLRALERTGEVRASAEDAGIDYSTAYARRRAHGDFAESWDAAIYRYALLKEQREGEEIAAFVQGHPTPATAVLGCPPDILRASSHQGEGGGGCRAGL